MHSSKMTSVADYKRYAEEKLPQDVLDYYNCGAFYEHTLRDSTDAFSRYRFRPRYMCDVAKRSLSTSLLGRDVKCPLGVSPVAMCCLAHPDGERALGRACEAEGLAMCLSMTSTTSMEEVARAAPNCTRWMQTHVLRDRDVMRRMLQRAESAGYSAVALTVDCPVHAIRYNELRNEFRMPPHLQLGNFEEELRRLKQSLGGKAKTHGYNFMNDDAITASVSWQDVSWIKSVCSLPVVVKGIMTDTDALRALDHGADAIWVSNHGGRELDRLPASIDVLSEVCRAVGDRAEVYMDGGIRSGVDALMALSLGARAVFFGRPALWGLAKDGEKGARHVMSILKEELSVAMALAGVTDVQNLPGDLVVPLTSFSKL